MIADKTARIRCGKLWQLQIYQSVFWSFLKADKALRIILKHLKASWREVILIDKKEENSGGTESG